MIQKLKLVDKQTTCIAWWFLVQFTVKWKWKSWPKVWRNKKCGGGDGDDGSSYCPATTIKIYTMLRYFHWVSAHFTCFHTPILLCSSEQERTRVHTFIPCLFVSVCVCAASVKVICILNMIIRLLLLFQFKLYYTRLRAQHGWSWPPTHLSEYAAFALCCCCYCFCCAFTLFDCFVWTLTAIQ